MNYIEFLEEYKNAAEYVYNNLGKVAWWNLDEDNEAYMICERLSPEAINYIIRYLKGNHFLYKSALPFSKKYKTPLGKVMYRK